MDKNGQVFDANHSFNGWQWEEWQKFEKKLWQLSLEELRELADILEIKFTMGNESINNEEDFINVLDEAAVLLAGPGKEKILLPSHMKNRVLNY